MELSCNLVKMAKIITIGPSLRGLKWPLALFQSKAMLGEAVLISSLVLLLKPVG